MLRILLATILLLLSGSLAHAAVCTVHVGDLDFGSDDANGNIPAMTNSEVSVTCNGITAGTSVITVCGSIGAGNGGVIDGVRQIVAGEDSLGFVFYADAGVTPWGTASGDFGGPTEIDVPVGDGESSAEATARLYGVVPKNQQSAPVGEYHASFSSADVVFTYAEGALNCGAPVGGTDTHASFAVSASIAANCLLQTSDLDFGTAGIIGANIDATADLSITCTPGTGYSISIDGGRSDDPDHRLLYSGANTVRYGLYADSGHSLVWGTDAPDTTVPGTGTGGAKHHPVYGRIPPQPAVAGAYADTVVVTITY